MQVQETRTEKSDRSLPGPRRLLPLVSLFQMRKVTAAVFVVLLLGMVALAIRFFWSGRANATNKEHWQQALKAIDDRDLKLAQSHLNRCLEANPLNAEAHFLMARTCRRTDDFEGWFDHLQSAEILGWSGDQIELELRLKEAQVGNTWKVEGKLQDYLFDRHPEEVLIVEALVKGYLENDRPKDAYRLADEWVKNFPDDWQARLYHGKACQLGLRFEEAIADYDEALKIKPEQPEVILSLAQTLTSYTQFDRAMEQYRAYLELRPGDADALLGLAKCQFTQGDSDSARATLDELFRAHPHHNAGLYLRAQLEQAESPEQALPWLRQSLDLAPNQPDVLHNFILALHALHRDKEAAEYEARLKECRQKVTQLIELKTRLVKESDSVDLRYQVAVLHLDLGQEDEAAHWFQTVLYIDPNHRPTLRALADYWKKHGNDQRADHYRELAEGKYSRE